MTDDPWYPEPDPPQNEVTPASEFGDLETKIVDGDIYCADCDVEVTDTGIEYKCPECGEYEPY